MSIRRQCELLRVARSGLYYRPVETLSIYQRYRIVSESDIRDALEKTQAAMSSGTQTRKVEAIPVAKKGTR